MQSRMNKYYTREPKKFERTKKNTKLYEEVYLNMYKDAAYKNMEVIDSAREIDLSKLKNILNDKYETRQYRTLKNYNIDDINKYYNFDIKKRNNTNFDINEVLKEAKNKRSFMEDAIEKNKFLEYDKEEEQEYDIKINNIKKEEKELEELINTMAKPVKENDDCNDALDLLNNLKGDDNTVVTDPISSSLEISIDNKKEAKENTKKEEKNKVDNTFYTDSNMFTKNDFEDFGTLTRELTKKSRKNKVMIVLLIILTLLAIFAVAYFVFKIRR